MLQTRGELRKARRVVFKVGTNLLFECNQEETISHNRLKVLARQVGTLHDQGREVLIVSSGAIGAGFKKLGLKSRPTSLKLKQACAAVGQVYLMAAWRMALAETKLEAAQVLISADDLADRTRFLNAKNTLLTLLEYKVIPIINENDTVAVDELKVGDNDTLGALVSDLVEADLFVNLSDVDGLYDADPRQHPQATILNEVEQVTPAIISLAGDGGPLGSGGMYTKVRAAKRLADAGLPSVIASGTTRNVLLKILDGEPLGTFFKPQPIKKMRAKKGWLAFASRPQGTIGVDSGCALAMTLNGKSLLPKGIVSVSGTFTAGDPVAVTNPDGCELALGLANYSSDEVGKILGCNSDQISTILGYCHSDEVIHRDNLVLSEGLL